jgi:hypothetical protein
VKARATQQVKNRNLRKSAAAMTRRKADKVPGRILILRAEYAVKTEPKRG